MPRDRFHDYLDKCEREPVSPGDFLEEVREERATQTYVRLVTDLLDTYEAGRLKRVILSNGGAAYLRRMR